MTVYATLLRGVNVGSKNRIKMADLQRTLESIGLGKVETYIQSGNIIFESSQEEEALQKMMELEIKRTFSLTIHAVLRSAGELEELIRNLPFSQEEINQAEKRNTEGESLYAALLSKAPSSDKIDALNKYRTTADEYQIRGRDVYLLLGHSIRKSKLAGSLQTLDEAVTARNWNTLTKLVELVRKRP
jgi:uncharacterized protein (DUF1697 family)